jgi:AcrR family transcriptional regulator
MNDIKKTRGRPKKETGQLDSNIILNCAKKLLLEDSKIPSIRKIALVLNIDPMSIYYYYPNKNNLLESITISLMKEIYKPKDITSWEKELKLLCKSYLTLLKNHPGLLEIMLGMDSYGPSNIFLERLRTILIPLALDEKSFNSALYLLVDYLHGVAFAMQCNSTNNKLSINHIEEPLGFYILAIKESSN